MKATLLLRDRVVILPTLFAELMVWRLPAPSRGSDHGFKYRLAIVSEGVCVVRYDNEAGKGDHKHMGEIEAAYDFTGIDRLMTDFWDDVEDWKAKS